jgi:hypothetical protein
MRRAAAFDERPTAKPGDGIDVDAIRRLLAMSPAERLHLLVKEARNLAAFDRAVKR